MEAWLAVRGGSAIGSLFYKHDGGGNDKISIRVKTSFSKMEFHITDPIAWTVETPTMYSNNIWFHFIFVHELNLFNSNIVFYKDGV